MVRKGKSDATQALDASRVIEAFFTQAGNRHR
jgi:hypothetical protein